MKSRAISEIVLTILMLSMLALALNIQPVESEVKTIIVPEDFATIQQAVNAAHLGDTIFVKSGTYVENVVVNKPLSLIGENKYNTIIDGNGTGSVVEVTSSYVTLADFTFQHSGSWPGSGVFLVMASGCNISHNIIADNALGIFMCGCSLNHFSDNVVLNSLYGIELYAGNSENVFLDNNCSNNAAGFLLCDANNNIFMNNVVSKGSFGFEVGCGSCHNIFCGNVVSNIDWGGIRILDSSCNNQVLGNEVSYCLDGIELGMADNNVVMGNTFTHMRRHAIIIFNAYNNAIIGNEILCNGYGFFLQEPCSNNIIYHNNIINNTQQVLLIFSPTNNRWNNGYPSGGNYWSDYASEDEYRGPYQNLPGSDGIGDTPYVINEQNRDDYPLMLPYSSHEIGIKSVKTSKSAVWQGSILYIDVIMVNYGCDDENPNLALYANGTTIEGKNITFPKRSAAILTFTWNTEGFAYGSYIISAYAPLVPGETVTTDNTMASQTAVKVKILGDVNSDNKVDIKDIAIAAIAFGSYPSDQRWNTQADINEDNKVDIRDIALIAKNFGKTHP